MPKQQASLSFLDKLFHIQEQGSSVRTEIIAGLTTFFTMAYIIAVNPSMLSQGDAAIFNGVFFATCLSAVVGCLLMAFLAKAPFAQASGMGLNAFFAFTVMPAMLRVTGKDLSLTEQYQCALALVFLSGLLFIVITVLGAREAIVRAIPNNIKIAITGGIGLFLAYLGFQTAHIVVPDASTQVALINFAQITNPESRPMVVGAILAIAGTILIAALYKLRVKGAILIGMLVTGVLCYLFGAASIPSGFSINFAAQAKDFVGVSLFRLDFATLFEGKNLVSAIFTILVLILSFSMVDMFDTIGTLLGTAQKAGLLDEKGEMPRMKQALLCDSIATASGALLGTSTVTTFVESSSGIAEGGRTGLTSLVTGLCFLAALVLAPFVNLIPGVATAPALIFVGALMFGGLSNLKFDDMTEAIPSFLTVAMMPLTYSIANGIGFGLISHCLVKLASGRVKETHWITWLISGLFILKFVLAV